jgi:ubiquinone/menaquinone biosynthesis C-methylase UbiE
MQDFLDPLSIIKQHLKPDQRMTAVDFGCGSGGWAIPLAKLLEEGKVYAIDILDEPLSALRGKIRSGGIVNIEIIKADVEKTIIRLLANSADIILMTNLLFQVKNKEAVFGEAGRILKPGGKIMVVEWVKNIPIGPKDKVNCAKIKETAQNFNFKLTQEFDAGSFHCGMIFEKK